MPTSETFPTGSVVVVPFPFSDRLAEKRRPAVVVSNARLAEAGFLWVAMVTSAKRGAGPFDLFLEDWRGAGLPAPSYLRPAKVACLEPTRILRAVGRLEPAVLATALARIRGFLD